MLQAKLLLRKCQSIKTPRKLLGTLLLELKLKNKLTNDIDLVRKGFLKPLSNQSDGTNQFCYSLFICRTLKCDIFANLQVNPFQLIINMKVAVVSPAADQLAKFENDSLSHDFYINSLIA